MYAANVDRVDIDISDFDNIDEVPHAHKFSVAFDEDYHWEECSICGKCKVFGQDFDPNNFAKDSVKRTHAKVNNNGSIAKCETGYRDNANRDTCNCGWRGKPIVIVHGRPYNYPNTKVNFNYNTMQGYNLDGIKKITQAQYNSYRSSYKSINQNYEYKDGIVYQGGPIMSTGGVIGTLEHILGNNGSPGTYDTGFGRHNEFDEIFIIVRYLESVGGSYSRQGFCNYLSSTSIPNYVYINNSDHLLHGCRDKYLNRVSDDQFNAIASEFRGYRTHTSGWRYGTMTIFENGHDNPGSEVYINSDCYDSRVHSQGTFGNMTETVCDLCGSHKTGREDYINDYWYVCSISSHIRPGETRECGGHPVEGLVDGNKRELGTVYCKFTRDYSNNVYRKIRVECNSGYTWRWEGNDTQLNNYSCVFVNDYASLHHYEYVGTVAFYNASGTRIRGRQCGYDYVLTDCTDPKPYGYDNGNKTNNQWWKIVGNGSPSKTSVRVTINVAFDDFKGNRSGGKEGYTYNQVYLKVYDSDKTTVIPQGNGQTEVALALRSGTDNIWQGIINIATEVKGTKNIYVQATDSTGNKSELIPMEIAYIDAKGPEIKVSVTPSTWSREKIIEIEGYDEFENVLIGFSASTMQPTVVSNKTGKRTYIMHGDLDGSRNVTFYTQDGSGNVEHKTVTISNLDNTPPKIIDIDADEVSHQKVVVKLDADDKTSDNKWNGSGIRKMFMSENADMSDPIEHAGDRLLEFEITKTGEYWFRGIDGVDFDSNIKKITLNSWLEDTNRTPEELPEPGNKSQYVQVDDGIGLSHPGYTIQKTIKTVDNNGNIVFDTYYRRNRYSIKYFGNKQTKGETYVQNIMWGQDFEILANKFERVYKYNLVADDDSRLDGDNGDFELEAKIEGGVEQLVETWTFQNWYFDNKNDSDRLASKTYLPGDKISSDSEHLTLKDGDVLTFTVQWEPGTVKLPNVTRTGSDFMGWFNKSQVIGTNDVEARLLGKTEKLTLDDLERRHIQNYDSNKEFTLYAWYNKRPVFVNIYDGVFFEGQKVTYTDLLELIGVWDYNDNYQELQLDNINLHFDNLIEIVDNDISTDRKDLAYLIEDKEDSGDESLLEDIKDLREHINELLKERSEIQKAKRKATQEVKVRKLEPVIAKIEYGALEDEEDYYDSRFGYEYVDYHSEEEASNGILVAEKKDELGNVIDYDTELLDTSTDKIGLLRITYQVHDDGIYYKDWSELDNEDDGQYGGLSEDFKHSETAGSDIFIPNSDVTIEYTRVCEIDFNYNPLLNLQNILQYSDFDFSNDLGKYVLDRQVLRDSEDLQDNLPWWSKKVGEDLLNGDVNADTQKKLQDSIRITGIPEITFNGTFEYEHPDEVNMFLNEYVTPEGDGNGNLEASGLYDKSSILKEIGKFKGNNEAYGSVTKNDIWENITSIGITFDGHDQFGKCASNQVIDDYRSVVDTKKRPIGYIPKYNSGFVADESSEEYDLRIYQTPFERTVYLVLINVENDSSLAYTRNKDRIRYINEKYLSGLGNTYWGTTGLADIQKVMDKAQFPEDEDYKEYTGEYEQDNKRKVKVEIKDYTDSE